MAIHGAKRQIFVAQEAFGLPTREMREASDRVARASCERDATVLSPKLLKIFCIKRDGGHVDRVSVVLSGIFQVGKAVKDNRILMKMFNTK